jgi:hypothetical protein
MTLRRTMFGMAMTAALTAGITGCGGAQSSLPELDTASSTTPGPTPAPTTAPAATTKVLADYKYFFAFRSRGIVSNDAAYPFEKVMTGKALQTAKSMAGFAYLSGRRYSGSYKYLSASVATVDLKAHAATVKGCAYDGLVLTLKNGKKQSTPGTVATTARLVLVGTRWMVTDTGISDAGSGGCA